MNTFFVLLLAVPAVLGQALQNTTVHPGLDNSKCLEVRDGTLANGTPVQINDCNGNAAQNWTIQGGSTKVMVAGTNFCLDAGSNPTSGVGMKIWQCYSGLVQQQWYLTDDHRIAVEGQGLCLDLTNGNTADGTQVQTWSCTDNNNNQVWNLGGTTPPPPPPPASNVVQLHPNGDSSKCLDVRAAEYANGTPVQIYDCNGTPAQNWILERGSTSVKVNGTNFCLDAGASPANGVQMKIWQCYDNLPAQEWYYTDDNRVALENQGFCLDLTNGVKSNSNPIQIWQCTDNDVYQIWTE
ncbi:hypothetical protein EIP86_007371 [Pleurotus ostreatoroseus]|nr:hypothetical protein EIP86_007371 [Pleurotus ostreatoroseus]